MSLRIVQLGSERTEDEGLRIGTVRRWFPNLLPSEALLEEFFPIEDDAKTWKAMIHFSMVAEASRPR